MTGPPVRRAVWTLAALFLLALGLRLLYFSQMSSSPLWDHPVLDEAVNHEWAAGLAAGRSSPQIPYFRAPLYPWMMGLLYRVSGPRPDAVRWAQALLSAVSCLLVFAIARQLAGPLAAGAAGLLAATYWPWIYFDGELQDVPLTLFLDLAALLLLLRSGTRPGGRLAAGAAGLALGLSAIARPTILLVVPVAILWLLCQPGAPLRRRAIPAGALLLGLILPILPVAAINRLVGGDAVLIASQGGLNLYLGNHPGADGHSARLPGASGEWQDLVQEGTRRAEARAGTPLRPSEVSRFWYGEAAAYWMADPLGALAATGRKLGLLLSAPELPNNKQIVFLTTTYAPVMRLPWPGFGLILPLAVVGLVFGRGGGRSVWLVASIAAAYGLGVVAFFVAARFRMPFAILLLPLAGLGFESLVHRLQSRDRRGLLALAAVGLAAALAVNLPARGFREDPAHAHYMIGNAYEARGDLEGAIAEFRQALAARPGYRVARRDLAAAWLALGRPQEVVATLGPQLAGDPDDIASRINLALALAALGRSGEARAELEDLARRAPGDAEVRIRLGNLQAESGDLEAAAADFAAALERDPDSATARYNLANTYLAAGRLADAQREYRELLRRHPDHALGWHNLAAALATAGRDAEALDAAGRAVALAPEDARLRVTLAQLLRSAGDLPGARRAFRQAAEDAVPGSEAARLAAEGLRQLGDGEGR